MDRNNNLRNYHEMELSFKEVSYLLFKKKKCPTCNAKIKRFSKNEFKGIEYREHMPSLNSSTLVGDFNIIEKQICYSCLNCKSIFTLKELI